MVRLNLSLRPSNSAALVIGREKVAQNKSIALKTQFQKTIAVIGPTGCSSGIEQTVSSRDVDIPLLIGPRGPRRFARCRSLLRPKMC
jgi:hypothetical protein